VDLDRWNPIIAHYESCFARHGATPKGADWPNDRDLAIRFGVMFEFLADAAEPPSVLDLGCGAGLALDYLTATGDIDRVRYHGIDLSAVMIAEARRRWPQHEFSCRDIITSPLPDESVDFVVMNGLLTERVSLSSEAMTNLAKAVIAAAYRTARIAIAFNAMNAHVDWQRGDLFHWPFDEVADFLKREVSPHYAFRADYGLYEYTCIVRRSPRLSRLPVDDTWWNG